jgi:hypothetical protein
MSWRRWGSAGMVLLAAGSLLGCTSESAAPEPGDETGDVPVTVRLMWGSQLADAPSSFLVRVTSADADDLVAGSATEAVTVDPAGLVLLEDVLPPGRYELHASQVGCGMSGHECPDDPESPQFDGAPMWSCSTPLPAQAGAPVQVQVVEGGDAARSDDAECLLEERPA